MLRNRFARWNRQPRRIGTGARRKQQRLEADRRRPDELADAQAIFLESFAQLQADD